MSLSTENIAVADIYAAMELTKVALDRAPGNADQDQIAKMAADVFKVIHAAVSNPSQ